MSGIINSAGSRSGVIGTTELDYEEGTFTITMTGSGGAPSSPQTTTGTYTKTGRMVYVHIYFSNKDMSGASGDLRLTGLPFTCDATYGSNALTIGLARNLANPVDVIGVLTTGNTTIVEIFNINWDGAYAALGVNTTSGVHLSIGGYYIANN